jgi:predicted CXXCH cytochrome family protein
MMKIGLFRNSFLEIKPPSVHNSFVTKPDSKPTTLDARKLVLLLLLFAVGAAGGIVWVALKTARSHPPAVAAGARGTYAAYGGSASCEECHEEEFAAWKNSNHGLAEREPLAAMDDAAFIPERTFHHVTQQTTVRTNNGHYELITAGLHGSNETFVVERILANNPLRQALIPFPGGRLQASEAAWDPRSNQWFNVYGTEDRMPGEWGHWMGRGMNWNSMCAICHNTRLHKNYDAASDSYHTTWVEHGVGCEACHGAGAGHVTWARGGASATMPHPGLAADMRDGSGGAWRFDANDPRGIARWVGPPRQGIQAGVESCAGCHARARPLVADPMPGGRFLDNHAPLLLDRGEYHANGQIQGEVFEWGSFAQSRMQQAGVVCADCHLPHSGKLRAEGNALCAQCHLPGRFEAVAHHRHSPGSAAAQCVTCHMPSVTYTKPP